jgi:hypothetical protein
MWGLHRQIALVYRGENVVSRNLLFVYFIFVVLTLLLDLFIIDQIEENVMGGHVEHMGHMRNAHV